MRKKGYFFLVTSIALASSIQALACTQRISPFGGLPSATVMFREFCADQDPRFKAKIAFAEAKLGLQPTQRERWVAFVAEASAAARPIHTLCAGSPPMADGDVAEELDYRQKMLAAVLETDRAFIEAAKKLLVGLDSKQQRALADAIIHPHGAVPGFAPPGPHP